jgi:hypothetical protein
MAKKFELTDAEYSVIKLLLKARQNIQSTVNIVDTHNIIEIPSPNTTQSNPTQQHNAVD